MRHFFLLTVILFSMVEALTGRAQGSLTNLITLEKIRSDPGLKKQIEEIVGVATEKAFGKAVSPPSNLDPIFKKPLPIFVTAKKSGEVRGCMGSLRAQQGSLVEEITVNLVRAFFQDPRHRPIREEELPGMEFYLTTVGTPEAVDQVSALNPARDAVMIRNGRKEAVVLPGEAKTLRYLLAFAKAKAGIKKGEPYQLFRIPTATIGIVLSSFTY